MRLLPDSLRNDAQHLFYGSYSEDPFAYPWPVQSDGTIKDQRRYAKAVITNIEKFMRRHEVVLKAHIIDTKAVYQRSR